MITATKEPIMKPRSTIDPAEYGYEEATPDNRRRGELLERGVQRTLSAELPRRSSMKQGCESKERRRASVHMGAEVTVYLPGRDEPVRRRSLIQFAETVTVRNIESVHKLTNESKGLWFQNDEYARMRRNSMELVRKVERGQIGVGNRNYCIRGLERLIHRDLTMQKRNEALEVVLSAQDLQWDRGYWDDECMAKAYKCSTSESATAAALRGKQDELAVFQYMNDLRIGNRRRSC